VKSSDLKGLLGNFYCTLCLHLTVYGLIIPFKFFAFRFHADLQETLKRLNKMGSQKHVGFKKKDPQSFNTLRLGAMCSSLRVGSLTNTTKQVERLVSSHQMVIDQEDRPSKMM
jgi:hypothetical protein